MKPLAWLMTLATGLWLAGTAAWLVDATAGLPRITIWLWLCALGSLCAPLVLLALACIVDRVRRGRP